MLALILAAALAQSAPETTEPSVSVPPLEAAKIPWRTLPSAEDFARVFPDGATRRGLSGNVVLDCVIAASGKLNCQVASESPPGEEFGAAALKLSAKFVARVDADPSIVGRHARIPLRFNLVRR